MKRLLLPSLALGLLVAVASPGHARPVVQRPRPAPDFTIVGGKSARSLLGQPIVIVVAPTPLSKEFRKQVRKLEKEYHRFAAQKAIFVAAFTASDGEGLRSSIPFAIARNGAELAARYGVQGPFALLVVGIDGNLDLRTSKVTGTYAVRDAILNNYQRQTAARRAGQ